PTLFFHRSDPPPHLHSFPTRRSSDLPPPALALRGLKRVPQKWTPVSRPERAQTFESRGGSAGQRLRGDGGHLRQGLHDPVGQARDRKSTRLNSSHDQISYAVFCLKKK